MLAYLRQGFAQHVKANIVQYFLVVLVFMLGIVAGAMAVKILPEASKVELAQCLTIFLQGIGSATEGGALLLAPALLHYLKMILLVWVLGFTIIGIPFVLFIVFTRGFIIGFTVGFLVNLYVFKGLFFAVVSVLPHNLLILPVLFLMSVAAMGFSADLIKRNKQMQQRLFTASLQYTAVCAFSCGGVLLGTLTEVYVSPVFMRLVAELMQP